eukprot:scaffold14833_cov125-Isochrysis_galbana.AAC.4
MLGAGEEPGSTVAGRMRHRPRHGRSCALGRTRWLGSGSSPCRTGHAQRPAACPRIRTRHDTQSPWHSARTRKG